MVVMGDAAGEGEAMNTELNRCDINRRECATPGGRFSGARILIVDDDVFIRELHTALLHFAGYNTCSASDGKDALTRLATEQFDLILTDCNMPHLDGIGLIRALRRDGRRVPVMMISGSLSDGVGLPADVRDHVAMAMAKPVPASELLAGVAWVLQSHEYVDGLENSVDLMDARVGRRHAYP